MLLPGGVWIMGINFLLQPSHSIISNGFYRILTPFKKKYLKEEMSQNMKRDRDRDSALFLC